MVGVFPIAHILGINSVYVFISQSLISFDAKGFSQKINGIDSGVGITIVSVAVYGTFIGAPASLGFVANTFGVNNVFTPTLIIFIILLIPIIFFKKEFKL